MSHARAAPRGALDRQRAAAGDRPLAKPHQAERAAAGHLGGRDAAAVVAHLQAQIDRADGERDVHPGGAGVARDVGQGLLEHAEHGRGAHVVDGGVARSHAYDGGDAGARARTPAPAIRSRPRARDGRARSGRSSVAIRRTESMVPSMRATIDCDPLGTSGGSSTRPLSHARSNLSPVSACPSSSWISRAMRPLLLPHQEQPTRQRAQLRAGAPRLLVRLLPLGDVGGHREQAGLSPDVDHVGRDRGDPRPTVAELAGELVVPYHPLALNRLDEPPPLSGSAHNPSSDDVRPITCSRKGRGRGERCR